MMVPVVTALDVTPELELPAVEAVLKLSSEVPADHPELVLPVTLNRVQVVAAPVKEVIVILGLQSLGAIVTTAEVKPEAWVVCPELAGLAQPAVALWPLTAY